MRRERAARECGDREVGVESERFVESEGVKAQSRIVADLSGRLDRYMVPRSIGVVGGRLSRAAAA